jgi:hypothetical protein
MEEDKMSEGSVWMTVQEKSRGAEDHVWVKSVTGEQGEESERVIGEG